MARSDRNTSTPSPALLIGRDWALAAVVLIFASATLALGTLWPSADSVELTGKPLVTIGEAPAAQAGSAVGETTGSGAQLGAKLADGLVLLPRRLADGGQALEVGTKSEGAVLAEAKLRAGDLIVGVDNQPMDSAGVQLLRQELAQADAVEISFLRAGQLRKRLIVLRA